MLPRVLPPATNRYHFTSGATADGGSTYAAVALPGASLSLGGRALPPPPRSRALTITIHLLTFAGIRYAASTGIRSIQLGYWLGYAVSGMVDSYRALPHGSFYPEW